MKKKIVVVIAILAMCFTFVACGGGEKDSYAGTWKAVSADLGGMEMTIEDLFGGELTFELKDGGECIINMVGEEDTGTWTETEKGFNVDGMGDFEVDGKTATADVEGVILTLEKQ